MDKQLFNELVESLNQGKAISNGKAKASRRFKVDSTDVNAIRKGDGLHQKECSFAGRVTNGWGQNWELHRRQPTGPAAALLKIVSTSPKLALQSLHG